jgi:hypothetical protein
MEFGFEYGVEWVEFNKKNQAVCKHKMFKTKEARDKFANKVQEKDNFWKFATWSN